MQILKGDKLLNKAQCDVLRGIAIAGIFLHNFCHLLKGSNEENEFTFIAERASNMWQYWTTGLDEFFLIQLFAFFGHYGVPIFFFLSGYGLVMKYENGNTLPKNSVWGFIGHHWFKLFKLMILGMVLTIIIYVATGITREIWEYFAQATLLSNIIPELCDSHTPSPYWFFGVMVELYVVYRLLFFPFCDKHYRLWRWLIPVLLTLLTLLPQVLMENHSNGLNYVRHNAAIAMLPFSLGVLVGRYGLPKLSRLALASIMIIALPLLAIVSMHYQSWLLLSPLVVLAGSLAFVKGAKSCCGLCYSLVTKPLHYLGVMSSMIFVVHSIARRPIYKFVLVNHSELMLEDYAWMALYIVVTLILAWAYKKIIRK